MTVIGRAFVAITPPDDVLDAIERTVSPVRRSQAGKKLRWAGRDQWHITLQFLGRAADADLLNDAVHEAVSGIAPFGAQFGGAGAFPSVAKANVLWAGVGEGVAGDGVPRTNRGAGVGAARLRAGAARVPPASHAGARRIHPVTSRCRSTRSTR